MDKILQAIKTSFYRHQKKIYLLSFGLVFIIGITILIKIYIKHYQNRFYPGTYIDQVKVAGLTLSEAETKLADNWLTVNKLYMILIRLKKQTFS